MPTSLYRRTSFISIWRAWVGKLCRSQGEDESDEKRKEKLWRGNCQEKEKRKNREEEEKRKLINQSTGKNPRRWSVWRCRNDQLKARGIIEKEKSCRKESSRASGGTPKRKVGTEKGKWRRWRRWFYVIYND